MKEFLLFCNNTLMSQHHTDIAAVTAAQAASRRTGHVTGTRKYVVARVVGVLNAYTPPPVLTFDAFVPPPPPPPPAVAPGREDVPQVAAADEEFFEQ